MALTYEKVIAVISRPPDIRKDFEVNNLLPWFRKKSELFRTLKTGKSEKRTICQCYVQSVIYTVIGEIIYLLKS